MKGVLKGALVGASFLAMTASGAQAQTAEVIHWWTSGGESAAINVFAEMFKEQGGTWIDNAVAGGSNARTAAITRAIGGDPATMWQFNTGKQFDDLVEQDLLRNLDDIAEAEGWRDFLPQTLIDATTRDGHFYAVPVNVHGQSWIFYNKPLFEELGAPAPDTWEEFFEAAEILKAAGKIPLAFAGTNSPSWERLTFTEVLLGQGGREFYWKVMNDLDIDAIRSDTFREAAETFRRITDYIDDGAPARLWNDATSLVITGDAGMQIMGDWAKGEFVAANKTAGVDYGCVIPGEDNFLMGGDVFVFSKTDDPEQIEAQNMLASIMISPEGQVRFNNFKGSVPVRQDVDTSAMDECAQIGIEVMGNPAAQIPGTNFTLAPDLRGALGDVMAEFWNDPDMSVDDFIDAYVEQIELAG